MAFKASNQRGVDVGSHLKILTTEATLRFNPSFLRPFPPQLLRFRACVPALPLSPRSVSLSFFYSWYFLFSSFFFFFRAIGVSLSLSLPICSVWMYTSILTPFLCVSIPATTTGHPAPARHG